jgi:hypothetical protein
MFIIESGVIIKEKKDGQKTRLKKGDVTGLLHFFQKDPSAATLRVRDIMIFSFLFSMIFISLFIFATGS